MADRSPSPSAVRLPILGPPADPSRALPAEPAKGSPTPSRRRGRRRLGDFSPGEAAEAELTWFFNEAEVAIDQPSNFQALLGGSSPTSLEQVERRAEAMHAGRKIQEWLQRLPATDALLLAGLYTERLWSRAVTRALPGGLAGAARVSVPVGTAYARALTYATTLAEDVVAFVEEIVGNGPADRVAAWREQIEVACAIAIRAYERVRRDAPSVVPEVDR